VPGNPYVARSICVAAWILSSYVLLYTGKIRRCVAERNVSRTLKGLGVDVILLVCTLIYWLESGKISAHCWESAAPWFWLLCVIVTWHSFKAAHLLSEIVT